MKANLQQVVQMYSERQRPWLLVVDDLAMEARARRMYAARELRKVKYYLSHQGYMENNIVRMLLLSYRHLHRFMIFCTS